MNKVQFKVKYVSAINTNKQKVSRYKCPCTVHLSLSLNSDRNGIIILASKQRLLWRIASEMFKTALEKLCFQAQTYMYTAEVPWISLIPVFYKITKIVCALWLAESCVCRRVCKHNGCGVKMFCFSHANHAIARIGKSFQVHNSTSLLYLPIPSSAETWKIVTKKVCQFFFRLSWHFKREKSVFWKASFCKTRTDYMCKTSWTRLCEWWEFLL